MSDYSGDILLVEDHQELAETVGSFLEASGFTVDYASDGLMAFHLASTQPFSAIVLDILLPGIDGIEVCRRLREEIRLTTPIIMLTARDRLDDKLSGFGVGCDDYLVKPFDLPELAVRLAALIRRERGLASAYDVGELFLDVATMGVSRGGVPIKLSRTSFEILKILMRESPKVVPRETLEKELWGENVPDSDALRSHLYNLRQAVDKPFSSPLIETLPARGYRVLNPN